MSGLLYCIKINIKLSQQQLCMEAYTYNANTREAETTSEIQGQLQLHKALSLMMIINNSNNVTGS